ncbi:MAG: TRAP transporter substrate-binding protein DctP [Pseudomonadota bacterium]
MCKPILRCLTFCIALMFIVTGTATAEKVLKMQLVYPENSSVAANSIFFADKVAELTKGEVKIKIFFPDQLVKAKEGLTAMQRGMIDGYIGSMLYFAGVVPEVNGEWLPFSWRNVSEAMDIYYKYGYLDLMREATAKQDCYYLAPISVATMGLLTKFPVNGMDDLKGKNIRAVGMEGKIVKALGGSAVSLSGAEQYTALQRGTADGTDYPWYTLRDYKFFEVVSYVSSPALHSPGMVEIVFGNKSWNTLSQEEKDAISQAGSLTSLHSAELSEKNDSEILAFCKEKNMTIIEMPGKEVERMITALKPVYEEHQAVNDICSRQIDILKAYFKKMNIPHPLLN